MVKDSLHSRDQGLTPFAAILSELCLATGAKCVALVDQEGETVDYGGSGEPFDIRILAAEWRIFLQRVKEASVLGETDEIMVRGREKSFFIVALPEQYALVMQLARRAATVSSRALSHARRLLCKEAGFGFFDTLDGDWRRVSVQEEAGHTRRPRNVSIDDQSHALSILGRILDKDENSERSYRVRLQSGEERTLVREPFGHWYMEVGDWVPVSRLR